MRAVKVNPRLFAAEPMRRCRLEECRAACCLYGVWVDSRKARQILARAGEILPYMPPEGRAPEAWFTREREPDPYTPSGEVVHSRVVDAPAHYGGTACIFLRADHKCALQVAAEALGEHPWRFKPFYCILHPLDLDDRGRITLDETRLLLDEPGSCLRPADTPQPLVQTFAPELRHLLGVRGYQRLRRTLGVDPPPQTET